MIEINVTEIGSGSGSSELVRTLSVGGVVVGYWSGDSFKKNSNYYKVTKGANSSNLNKVIFGNCCTLVVQ